MSSPESQYMSAPDLEDFTGVPASTWRYFAHVNQGPASLKIGRRRVWKRETVLAWLAERENVGNRDGGGVG